MTREEAADKLVEGYNETLGATIYASATAQTTKLVRGMMNAAAARASFDSDLEMCRKTISATLRANIINSPLTDAELHDLLRTAEWSAMRLYAGLVAQALGDWSLPAAVVSAVEGAIGSMIKAVRTEAAAQLEASNIPHDELRAHRRPNCGGN